MLDHYPIPSTIFISGSGFPVMFHGVASILKQFYLILRHIIQKNLNCPYQILQKEGHS